MNWKYISLFATTGDAEKDKYSDQLRNQNMEKILKTVQVKNMLREQEMLQAEEAIEHENHKVEAIGGDISVRKTMPQRETPAIIEKTHIRKESTNSEDKPKAIKEKKERAPHLLDPFFAGDQLSSQVEKRVVARDGLIPKL